MQFNKTKINIKNLIKNYFNKLKKFLMLCIKKWYWILFWLSILLIVLNRVWENNDKFNLVISGISLILFGIINLKSKEKEITASSVIISLGVFSIFTSFLLGISIDVYEFIFLILIILNIVIHYSTKDDSNIFGVIVNLAFYSSMLYLNTILIRGAFEAFSNISKETLDLIYYLIFLALFILINLSSFVFVEKVKSLLKFKFILNKWDRFVSMAIAANIVILIGGFFYLKFISKDIGRDFLIILGLALISSFSSVASIKEILNNSHNP